MKMRIRYRILALAAAALLSGCAKESAVMNLPEAEKVTVQIKTKALTGSVVEGVTIEKVRFMLFQNETLLNNYTTSNGTLNVDDSGLFNLAVSPGVYSFAAIINETPELTEKLNAVTKRTDIDGIEFDWQSSALTSGNMPLANLGEIKIQPGTTSGQGMAQLRPVYNSEGGRYKGDFTTASTTASIDMPRVMSQVSVFLRQDDAVTEEIKISNVQVSNIPRYSYLIDQQDTDNTNLNLFNGPEFTISASGGGKEYNGKQYHPFPTAIIAEKSFYKDGADDETKAADPDYAAYIFINATYGGIPTTYKILLREGDANFRLLRNTNYNVYATIKQIGSKGIYVVIEPVKLYNIAVNWAPVEGLVIVSDREADFNKNVNVWSDYTAYSGILKVYKGDAYHDALFKYGSLIAVHSAPVTEDGTNFDPPATAEALNDVLWYPSSYDPLTITGWSNVPYLAGGEISAGNTPEQVKQGLGDPCKLAGLSETQIRDMGIVDNGQWHMATPEEYNHIIAASNNEVSSYGYLSYHWLLFPHNRYRDESGASRGDGTTGCYWSNNASIFDFSGTPTVTANLRADKDRRNGYMVRCVRNEIPESYMRVGIIISPDYQGTESGKTAYFGIDSNIPYWTATLVTSGTDVGTVTTDDFSFESGNDAVHTTHGSNTQNIPIYVKRKESTSSRSFRVRVEGIGLDGQTKSTLLTISQAGYQLRASSELSTLDVLPQEGGTYNLNIKLTPTDVPIPAGNLYVQVVYSGEQISVSDKVETASNTYSYPVSITIPANKNPSLIGITVYIVLERETGVGIAISSLSIDQKGTK